MKPEQLVPWPFLSSSQCKQAISDSSAFYVIFDEFHSSGR